MAARLRRFDGEYRWFQFAASPVPDEQGTLIRCYGISVDIDDLKRSEQKLREDEASLRTITDAIHQSVVVLSPDGKTLYANRVALDRSGLTPGEVNSEGFFARAFHSDDVDRVREERRVGLQKGIPFELEMRSLIKDGEYRVACFARGSGKKFRQISKGTLEILSAYAWPGNIRELQNVVERAVIVSESDKFVVDESWFKREPANSGETHEGLSALTNREVEMIEAALAESHGRISGPAGAAAKLGIPRQTLESKIRRFGIDRYGQKRPSTP